MTAKGIGDQGGHRTGALGYEVISRVKTHILTSSSMSGRVNSKKEM